MELAQKYAYTVYQEKSFSKAAKALFISQPSLSAMIKKLERELGFPIFDRSKNPLLLTPAGSIYIDYLEEIIENERVMQHRIRSLSELPSEELSVGGGSFLSRAVFSRACREFREENPDVGIKIDMGAHGAQHNIKDKLERGFLDVALTYTFDANKFVGIPIIKEKYFLAMKRDIRGAAELLPYAVDVERIIACDECQGMLRTDYNVPSNMPLIRSGGRLISYMSMLRDFVNEFSPAGCYVTNSRSPELSYDLMLEGVGCLLVTDVQIAAMKERSRDVIFIPIGVEGSLRTAYIIHKREGQLSGPARSFIDIIVRMCEDKKQFLKSLALGRY